MKFCELFYFEQRPEGQKKMYARKKWINRSMNVVYCYNIMCYNVIYLCVQRILFHIITIYFIITH